MQCSSVSKSVSFIYQQVALLQKVSNELQSIQNSLQMAAAMSKGSSKKHPFRDHDDHDNFDEKSESITELQDVFTGSKTVGSELDHEASDDENLRKVE